MLARDVGQVRDVLRGAVGPDELPPTYPDVDTAVAAALADGPGAARGSAGDAPAGAPAS
ncbi:hypothetical protein D3C74_383490 [compost metagenome]